MTLRRILLGHPLGQIAVPSLFVIPSLFLFVFLIYETAKLSREKIRHQFAVDSAAFVEMTNYADFLNRTAYVNGAFPQRIFAEGFMNGPMIPMKKNDALKNSLYDILFCNGAFPRQGGPMDGLPAAGMMDSQDRWDIRFSEESGNCGASPGVEDSSSHAGRNLDPPMLLSDTLQLLTMKNALQYYLSWEDAQDIYKLYVQIYQLLGSVEDAQYSVFKRLTQGANPHTFYRKSYWLNTGDNVSKAAEGAAYFTKHQFQPRAKCIQKINIVGNKPTNDPYQPYKQVEPQTPIDMPKTVTSELCNSGEGLFQMAYMESKSHILDLTQPRDSNTDWPGYAIVQHWEAPSNYFKVSFTDVCEGLPGGTGPCVHSTIALTGPDAVRNGSAGVWPNPTPKYQTRLFP